MASHWKGHLIRCRAQISRNLERHRKSYEFKVFAQMPHGWLNDTMPGRYRQAQSEAAWAMMIDFLNRAYAGAYPPWPCAVALRFGHQCGLRLQEERTARMIPIVGSFLRSP